MTGQVRFPDLCYESTVSADVQVGMLCGSTCIAQAAAGVTSADKNCQGGRDGLRKTFCYERKSRGKRFCWFSSFFKNKRVKNKGYLVMSCRYAGEKPGRRNFWKKLTNVGREDSLHTTSGFT
ncbi:hypothetical protein CHARACLAT_005947 [Characodon lateralis]|uniref:Uncharacterized protein n=1 Tax=Characodon lateralis TaxID=208331 RepID=A0ABU7CYV8_9TELE|nr:hypothetical protein [Characodon lateralis]